MTFVYLQRNIVDNNKDLLRNVRTIFVTKGFWQTLRAHSDIRKASGLVITTEPLGIVMTKQIK